MELEDLKKRATQPASVDSVANLKWKPVTRIKRHFILCLLKRSLDAYPDSAPGEMDAKAVNPSSGGMGGQGVLAHLWSPQATWPCRCFSPLSILLGIDELLFPINALTQASYTLKFSHHFQAPCPVLFALLGDLIIFISQCFTKRRLRLWSSH